MKMIAPTLILIGLVFAAWWYYRYVTLPDRLIAEARWGEISGSEPGLKHQHEKLKSKAAEVIAQLGDDEFKARESFANLLAGIRYFQLTSIHQNVVQQQTRYSWTEPDQEIVDLLVQLYLDEWAVTKEQAQERIQERLLAISLRAGKTDFLTNEAFTRRCWEQVPGYAKHPLSFNISDLLRIATTPADEAADQYSGWYGVTSEGREQRQRQMMDRLQEWAIPALVAAANGEEVPQKDIGLYRHTALSFGLEVE